MLHGSLRSQSLRGVHEEELLELKFSRYKKLETDPLVTKSQNEAGSTISFYQVESL